MHTAAGQQAPAPAAATAADATALLVDFRNSIPEFAASILPAGEWVLDGTPCSAADNWTYVICTGGQVTGLAFVDIPLSGGAPDHRL